MNADQTDRSSTLLADRHRIVRNWWDTPRRPACDGVFVGRTSAAQSTTRAPDWWTALRLSTLRVPAPTTRSAVQHEGPGLIPGRGRRRATRPRRRAGRGAGHG